jgi:hypothetical protein
MSDPEDENIVQNLERFCGDLNWMLHDRKDIPKLIEVISGIIARHERKQLLKLDAPGEIGQRRLLVMNDQGIEFPICLREDGKYIIHPDWVKVSTATDVSAMAINQLYNIAAGLRGDFEGCGAEYANRIEEALGTISPAPLERMEIPGLRDACDDANRKAFAEVTGHPYVPKTELGRTLWEARKRIEASGEPLKPAAVILAECNPEPFVDYFIRARDYTQVMVASSAEIIDEEGAVCGYKIKTGALHHLIGLFAQTDFPVSIPINLPTVNR